MLSAITPQSLHWHIRPSATFATVNSICLLFSHLKPSTHLLCCRHAELLPSGSTYLFHLHSPPCSIYCHHSFGEAFSGSLHLHVTQCTPHKGYLKYTQYGGCTPAMNPNQSCVCTWVCVQVYVFLQPSLKLRKEEEVGLIYLCFPGAWSGPFLINFNRSI